MENVGYMGALGCPIERAVNVFDGKWTLLVFRELLGGTKRFGELRATLHGVSPKTLTERLRALEASGVVERTVFREIPPRVEYSLTPLGMAARPVIDALKCWGEALTSEH